MSDATFPGPLAPPMPGIRLRLPADWTQVPADDALLRLVEVRAPGQGSAQIVVRVLIQRGALADAVLAEVLETERRRILARSADSANPAANPVVDPDFEVRLGATDARGFNAWWVEAGAEVLQVFLVAAPPEARPGTLTQPIHQVLCLTGELRGPDAEQRYASIQTILESLVVTWAGA